MTAAAFAILLPACQTEEPCSGCQDSGIHISVSMNDHTKSILHSTDLTGSTKIKLYDIVNDGSSFAAHINGATTSYGTPEWDIDGAPYSWYRNSSLPDHNFFGILTADKDDIQASSLFGIGQPSLAINGDRYTFQYPSTAILLSSTQFDACHSDITVRDKASANFTTVEIPMRHLLTCFGISAHNYNNQSLTVKSVKLHGLTNKKSADITYNLSTSATSVYYTPDPSAPKSWTTEQTAVELLQSPITLESDHSCANIITAFGSHSSSAAEYFIMWPQTVAELTPTNPDIGRDESGSVIKTDSDPMLVITYAMGTGEDIIIPVPLPHDQDWAAGHCRKMELSFTSKSVTLTAETLNWNYEEATVDYSGNVTIKENGHLKFIESSCYIDDYRKMVFFRGGNPITATFALDTPVGDTWIVSKSGDFDAFEIDNVEGGVIGDKKDFNYGTIDGNVASFTIMPTVSAPLKEYSITLEFAVRTTTERVIDITDLVQTEKYTIVLQAL